MATGEHEDRSNGSQGGGQDDGEASLPYFSDLKGFWDHLGLAALRYAHGLYAHTFPSAKFEETAAWQQQGMLVLEVGADLQQARMQLEGHQSLSRDTYEAVVSHLRKAVHHYSEHVVHVERHLADKFLPESNQMLDSWIDKTTLEEQQRQQLLRMRQASLNCQMLWLVWQVSRLILEMVVLACPWRTLRERLCAAIQNENTQAVDSITSGVPALEQRLRTYPRIREPSAVGPLVSSIETLRDLRHCYLNQVVMCMGLLTRLVDDKQQLIEGMLLDPDGPSYAIVQAIAVDVLDGLLPPDQTALVGRMLREYEYLMKDNDLPLPAVVKRALKRVPRYERSTSMSEAAVATNHERRRVHRRRRPTDSAAPAAGASPPDTPDRMPDHNQGAQGYGNAVEITLADGARSDTDCVVCGGGMTADNRAVLSCSLQNVTYATPHCVCTTCWARVLSAHGPVCPHCKHEGVHVVFDVDSAET